jgi:hypothetical protein
LTVKARKALDHLWKTADLKGRTWGPKNLDNPYSATNITICLGSELVSISQDKKTGKLSIHEFVRSENTDLGSRIKKTLKEEGLLE